MVLCDMSPNKTGSFGGFLGGSVAKNPSANAGDTGPIPDLRRSHVLRDNSLSSRAQEPQILSLRAATAEDEAPRTCAPQQEKPLR